MFYCNKCTSRRAIAQSGNHLQKPKYVGIYIMQLVRICDMVIFIDVVKLMGIMILYEKIIIIISNNIVRKYSNRTVSECAIILVHNTIIRVVL